jgi:transcriptional regulator with XRE-family HTH domain
MPMERERYPDDWERIATAKKEAEIIYVMDRARRSRGLSMGCVAQRAGINPYYYSTIVRGMHSPTLHMLCRILRVLGLELTLRRIKMDDKARIDR